jgi:hypothetical protein
MADLFRIATPTLGVVVVVASVVALVLVGQGAYSGSARDSASVASTTPAQAPLPEVPPIDAAAPARLETATFALG